MYGLKIKKGNNVMRIILSCFVLGLSVVLNSAWSVETKKPNIVFILVDDMGYGDLASYNPQSKIRTPNIDSLADAGLRFTDAHSAGPLCHPSRYGLLTGRYSFRTDVSVWRQKALIDSGQATIASVLKSQNYRTAMVGKWHLGFHEDGYENPLPGGPVDVGFDSYFGIRASTDIPPYFYIRGKHAVMPPSNHIEANNSDGWTRIQGAFWRAGGISPDLKLEEVLPRFTNEAIEVIDNHKGEDKPLFLYLAYPAPHTPWLPSEEFAGKSKAGMYGDFMEMVDAMIGRVLTAVQEAGMADDTLVIFSSDNGPTWYDQDVKRFDHDSAAELRGMKGDGWEAGHRMPFIVRWPGKVKPGSSSDQMICFTDVLATFAAISGAELTANAGPDSFNFLPVLLGEQADDIPVRKTLAVTSGNSAVTLRMGFWKYMPFLGSGGFTKPSRIKPEPNGPTGQLYNLAVDIGETNNLFLERPDIVKQMELELKRIKVTKKTRP